MPQRRGQGLGAELAKRVPEAERGRAQRTLPSKPLSCESVPVGDPCPSSSSTQSPRKQDPSPQGPRSRSHVLVTSALEERLTIPAPVPIVLGTLALIWQESGVPNMCVLTPGTFSSLDGWIGKLRLWSMGQDGCELFRVGAALDKGWSTERGARARCSSPGSALTSQGGWDALEGPCSPHNCEVYESRERKFWKGLVFESWDFDGCRFLFPWKRGSELENEPVSSALGAPDSWGRGHSPTSSPGGLRGRLERRFGTQGLWGHSRHLLGP